jgi:hypothetical protein
VGLPAIGLPPHLPVMPLDLTDEEGAALMQLLNDTVNNDRLSAIPSHSTLKGHPGCGD